MFQGILRCLNTWASSDTSRTSIVFRSKHKISVWTWENHQSSTTEGLPTTHKTTRPQNCQGHQKQGKSRNWQPRRTQADMKPKCQVVAGWKREGKSYKLWINDARVLILVPTVVCCDMCTILHKVHMKRATKSSLQRSRLIFKMFGIHKDGVKAP